MVCGIDDEEGGSLDVSAFRSGILKHELFTGGSLEDVEGGCAWCCGELPRKTPEKKGKGTEVGVQGDGEGDSKGKKVCELRVCFLLIIS